MPKSKFSKLTKNHRSAKLRAQYLDKTDELIIKHGGKEVLRDRLDTPTGQKTMVQFFSAFTADEYQVHLRLPSAMSHDFFDMPKKYLPTINI